MIGEGKLRRATQADYDAWVDKVNAPYRKFNPDLAVRTPSFKPARTYVVLAPIDLPIGLRDNMTSLFIVPEGIPAPTGAHGSWILMMSTGTCVMFGNEFCAR